MQMISASQFPRIRIALIALMSYLALLLHPLLGHADLYQQAAHSAIQKQTATISAVKAVQEDCPVCQMAGSMTAGTVVTHPVCMLSDFPQIHSFEYARPVSRFKDGYSHSRAPPV